MKNFIFHMENMDCPHCAVLIENAIKKLPDCKNASVNLITQELIVEFSAEKDADEMQQKLQELVPCFEPEAHLPNKQAQKTSEEQEAGHKNHTLWQIIASALLFAAGFVLHLTGGFAQTAVFLFLASYAVSGYKVLLTAVKNIARGRVFDENFLMSIASIGAIAISSFEEAAGVMLFYQIGEYFQSRAVERSRRSINELIDNRPDFALLRVNGKEIRLPAANIKAGQHIIVKPGEKIPLDGIVIEGSSSIDTKTITGEPLPAEAYAGSEVLAGCINLQGVLVIKVSREYDDSVLANICRLIESSAASKAPVESFISRFAKIYTPIVVSCAAALCILPTLFGFGSFADWLYRALVFLVVSCPCALVISVPLSFFASIGGASKKGIFIKVGSYLSALAKCKTIAFDKTGTLTKGEFKVEGISSFGNIPEDELAGLAALAESRSNHPIARSICQSFGKELDKARIGKLEELAGLGIEAQIDGKNIIIGNERLLKQKGISYPASHIGRNHIYIAIEGQYTGFIYIADEIKEDSADVISALKNSGIKTIMLTGDAPENAERYAKELGMDEYYAGLLPADKVSHTENLHRQMPEDSTLCFVGDGVNDAPALALCDVGIAMGGAGSDAAIEAADIVIMNDEPRKILEALKISKKTMSVVKQNIVFALGIKILILLLAAFGLAGMWAAVFADVGVAVLAILNAARAARI